MAGGRELVIFPGALGDLICVAPALQELIARSSTGMVDLMAKAELAKFATGRLGIAQGYSIDRVETTQLFIETAHPADEARRFFGEYGRVHSFFAADEEAFRRNLARVSREASFYRFRPEGPGHAAEAYLRAIGAEGEPHISLQFTDDDLGAAETLLKREGLREREFLLILPGSGSPAKNWPARNFATLAQARVRSLSSLIALGPAETGLKERFAGSGARMIENPELGTLAAIARACRAFIGNDSGVSHLAAAAGARGLVIFGPSDPVRWRPRGSISVIQEDPLEHLSVEAVEAVLRALLEGG